MPAINLSGELRDEYKSLFDSCVINNDKEVFVNAAADKIIGNKGRYQSVSGRLNIPWYFIAALHNMESSQNFNTHLHNGDPLTGKTFHVPAGRLPDKDPPYTWEESAADALQLHHLDQWYDWSIEGILYKTEEYNGWGYRLKHPSVKSPYLWSFSNHYTKGKFVKDGVWDENAVSNQCGAAVILFKLSEKGEINFPVSSSSIESGEPLLKYSNTKIKYGEELQAFLNKFPGIALTVDGAPGAKTSDAFKKVAGYYLKGDKRAG